MRDLASRFKKVTTSTLSFMQQDEKELRNLYDLPESTALEVICEGSCAVVKKPADSKTGSKEEKIAFKLSLFSRGQKPIGLAKLSFTLDKGECLGLTVPHHPNIVKTHGILLFDNKQNKHLLMTQQSEIPTVNKADYEVRASVLEFVKGSDLFSLIYDKITQPSISLADDVVGKVCDALIHLHNHGLIYRDLKPENILYSPPTPRDRDSTVKLCDMGFLKHLEKDASTKTYCGTAVYMAPEINEKDTYTQTVDVWALGILYHELLTGKLPFKTSKSIFRQEAFIRDFAKMTAPDKKESLSEKARKTFQGNPELLDQPLDRIVRLTEHNPNERMSLEDLKTELSGDGIKPPSPKSRYTRRL